MTSRLRAIALPLALAATLLPLPTCALATGGDAATAPSARIPEVHTTSLTGQSVDLPAQLRTRQAAVLILGFSKESRLEARDWGRRLATDFAGSQTVLYFEMPVLAAVPRLLRPWVLRQIAAEVSDRGKPHFVPITDHEAQWRALARVGNTASAYVLLVNREGDVVSIHSGAPSDVAYAALRRDMDALHSPGPGRTQ